MYQQGVSAISYPGQRELPEHKTVNYLGGLRALQEAQARGAHEALYRDADGGISEGVTSNVHVLRGKQVLSPANGCLNGITRRGLIPLAQELGLEWQDHALGLDDLYNADEVWISSAIRELLPVVEVDGKPIGSGQPGPWASALRQRYHQQCLADAMAEAQACS